jgi:ATP-binding cassette subfamily B protein
MWNRQREAEAAREKLARIEEDAELTAPNRNPPRVEEGASDAEEPSAPPPAIVPADAAE